MSIRSTASPYATAIVLGVPGKAGIGIMMYVFNIASGTVSLAGTSTSALKPVSDYIYSDLSSPPGDGEDDPSASDSGVQGYVDASGNPQIGSPPAATLPMTGTPSITTTASGGASVTSSPATVPGSASTSSSFLTSLFGTGGLGGTLTSALNAAGVGTPAKPATTTTAAKPATAAAAGMSTNTMLLIGAGVLALVLLSKKR